MAAAAAAAPAETGVASAASRVAGRLGAVRKGSRSMADGLGSILAGSGLAPYYALGEWRQKRHRLGESQLGECSAPVESRQLADFDSGQLGIVLAMSNLEPAPFVFALERALTLGQGSPWQLLVDVSRVVAGQDWVTDVVDRPEQLFDVESWRFDAWEEEPLH